MSAEATPSESYADNPVIPRLSLTQDSVRSETIVHHMNRYNLAARAVNVGSKVVDVCCGTGYGTDILRRAGASDATGIDLSEEAIEFATEAYPDCHFVNGDANPFLRSRATAAAGRLDVITFFEAIEHVPREIGHQILDSVQIGLAEGGSFFMSTPRNIRADVNPDHITQWGFTELEDILGNRFGKVDLFGQDWASGEFVYNDSANASFFVAHCNEPLNS
jgi:SAM-dependent methyltransferase